MPPIFGTNDPDSLKGGVGDDAIYGWTSDDPNQDPYGVGDDDTLDGGAGNDTLYGGNGSDVLIGGAGDDLIVDHDDAFRAPHAYAISAGEGDDAIRLELKHYEIEGDAFGTIDGGTGQDTLEIEDGRMLGDLSIVGVETLSFRGGLFGTAEQFESFESIDFVGFSGGTLILSKAGSIDLTDELAAETGVSVMGSAGDDRIEIDNAAGVEIRGEDGDDTLIGGSGKDWLIDFSGDNQMIGRGGDDQIDVSGDKVFVDGGSGDDDIYIGVMGSGTLIGGVGRDVIEWIGYEAPDLRNVTFEGVEELRLVDAFVVDQDSFDGVEKIVSAGTPWPNLILGAAGRFALDDRFVGQFEVTGSDGDDHLLGRDGYDILRGAGGADTIEGGDGVDELDGGDGSDTLSYATSKSGVTIDLSSDYADGGAATDDVIENFENLIGSSRADHLTGDGLSNRLEGAKGNDKLDGGGGTDQLVGGKGDDTYVINGEGDQIVELAKGGSDTVISKISFSLAGLNVENLELGGRAHLEATGSDAANRISGNVGRNVIDGGLGKDVLAGGKGGDTFVFSTTLGGDNVDGIVDFQPGKDRIQLDADIFETLDLGKLGKDAFVVGAAAADAEDRIIYDRKSGVLLYDQDGSKDQFDPVKFATLSAGLQLENKDFVVA